MKKALLLVVGLSMIFTASLAFGQAGNIMLWTDPGHTMCDTPAAGFLFWYLTFEGHNGATAVQFAIDTHGNFVKVADSWAFQLVIGASDTGVAIAFGSCLASPINLGNVIYNGLGTAAPCSTVDIVPDPGALSGTLEMVDCAQNTLIPGASHLTVASDGSCQCGVTVPVEETNWGQIKALYNN